MDGCESRGTWATLTIRQTPEPPGGEDVTICEGDEMPVLTVSGENVRWYADSGRSELLHAGIVFSPAVTAPGIYTYYATRMPGECESEVRAIVLEIKPAPDSPVAESKEVCEGEDVPDLVAQGTGITWYGDEALSEFLATGTTYATGAVIPGTYDYYVTSTQDGCTSDPVTCSLTIKPTPLMPVAVSHTVCQGDDVPDLLAEGEGINWYADPGLVQLLFTGNTYRTGLVLPGEYRFYATATENGCEGPAAEVLLTILEAPPAPQATGASVCEGDPVPALTATGDSLRWFDDPALEQEVGSGESFVPDVTDPGTYSFYVIQWSGGCPSAPVQTTLVIRESPPPPQAGNVEYCEGEGPVAFNATGERVQWYDDPTLSIVIYSGNEFTPPWTEAGSYPYYLTQTMNGCEGEVTTVVLTIKPLPEIDLGSDTVIRDDQTLVLGPFDSSYEFLWNDGSSQSYLIFDGKDQGPGEHLVSLVATHDGCVSSDTVMITVVQAGGTGGPRDPGSYRIYPNPSGGAVTVECADPYSDDILVEVYSASGMLLQQYRHRDLPAGRDQSFTIRLEAPGIYFMRITDTGTTLEYKVIRY